MDSDKQLASESDARPEETTQTPAEGDQPSPETPESDGDQVTEAEPSTPEDGESDASGAPDADGEPAAAKPDEDKGETAEQRKRRRRRQSAKQRIDQLTAEKRAFEQENARLRDQLAQQSVAKPDRDDFDDDADYTAAVAKFAVHEVNAQRDQAAAKQTEASAADKRNEIFLARVEERLANGRMEDFNEVFHDTLPITETMADVIAESDKGPEIAYYLGKNQTELRDIARMPPIQAARALGQLEGRLSRSTSKKRSTAPAPPKTLSGTADSVAPSLDEMSMEEYRQARGYEPRVK